MNCPKCSGLLIREELREQGGQFQGWRCIQCGFRLDRMIARNRTTTQPDRVTGKPGNSSDSPPKPSSVRTKRAATRI